jgi:hypothetical protein
MAYFKKNGSTGGPVIEIIKRKGRRRRAGNSIPVQRHSESLASAYLQVQGSRPSSRSV